MKKIVLLLSVVALTYSCKKEPVPTPEPAKTGNLSGKVIQYDQFGSPYTTGLNTTLVTMVGKNLSATTDVNGNYNFSNIASGTYTLSFEKAGSGKNLLQAIAYKYTDTTRYNVAVADIPGFQLTNAYVKDTLWFSGTLAGFYYNANTSPANNKATAVAIVGKSSNITLADPNSYLNFAPSSLLNTLDYGRFLSYSFLKQTYGFKKDSTIYVKIYPVSNTGSTYIDNQLNRPVYHAFGSPSSTFTLTIP